MRALVIAVGLVATSVPIVSAQSGDANDFPSDVLLLTQSEVDYLEDAGREISLALVKAKPDQALKQIARIAGLALEIEGTLPRRPALTKSFENATVKEVLTWYAGEVPVVYRAKDRSTLVVVARGDADEGRSGAGAS